MRPLLDADGKRRDLDLTQLNVIGEEGHMHIAAGDGGDFACHRVHPITFYHHGEVGHLLHQRTYRILII